MCSVMLNKIENGQKRRKFKFTEKEDESLRELVNQYGTENWHLIAKLLTGRSARQCRDRWNHYLSQTENKRPWTETEDYQLISFYQDIGSRWATIASYFPERTPVDIRNRCCRLLRKRAVKIVSQKSRILPPQPKMECNSKLTLPSCSTLPFPFNISFDMGCLITLNNCV